MKRWRELIISTREKSDSFTKIFREQITTQFNGSAFLFQYPYVYDNLNSQS